MPVRIQDVARSAGVSTATVSRALRGLPNVSDDTRLVVSRVASELGYVASRSASTLASGRTLTVAVLAPYAGRWFFAQAIEAVERELRSRGYDALLVGVGQPLAAGGAPFEPETLRGRVDAVVVLTVPLTPGQLDGLRALDMPLTFLGAAVPGSMSVRIDDVAVGELATGHLLGLGHTRVAHVGGEPEEPLGFSAPADRRGGWLAAMRAAGLAPDPEYDLPGLFTPEGGWAAGVHLLELPEPPSAVFAASDEMAFGVLAAARSRGVRVPDQLSVIGVDGHELSVLCGLTTVEQPVQRQGRLAAQMVLAALHGSEPTSPMPGLRPGLPDRTGTVGDAASQLLLPVRLVVRGTTGPCANPSTVP